MVNSGKRAPLAKYWEFQLRGLTENLGGILYSENLGGILYSSKPKTGAKFLASQRVVLHRLLDYFKYIAVYA